MSKASGPASSSHMARPHAQMKVCIAAAPFYQLLTNLLLENLDRDDNILTSKFLTGIREQNAMQPIQGLHHITAVARDPQRNIDFYHNLLGQRLIKKTVNFDVTDTYHFYFADEIGTPGSVLTFFAWPDTDPAVRGNGEAQTTAYNVPAGALGFWQAHLKKHGVDTLPVEQRFGADVLAFDDPDGMRVELIETDAPPTVQIWEDGPIPAQAALRGFHGTTLWLADVEATAAMLTGVMGYRYAGQEGNRYRFLGAAGAPGNVLDILHRPGQPFAHFGAGSIHHIAFRVRDDAEEVAYQAALLNAGFRVTPVRDRSYFHSIYWRTPGGVLFEIATDTPGFTIDESVADLGSGLRLPPWLEPQREQIAASLAPVTVKPIVKAEGQASHV